MQKKPIKRKTEIEDSPLNSEESNDLSNDDEPEISDKKKIKLSKSRDKHKILKSAKYTKQPTVEELNRLHETENLFNSNFFRLQIDEILKEVAVKPKHVTLFDKWLSDFNKFISNFEEITLTHKDNDTPLPILLQPREVSESVTISSFEAAEIVGSLKYGGILGPNLNVDLKINLPKTIFYKSDFVNEKCVRKKAICLKYLALKCQDSELIDDVKYTLLNGCNYKPALVLKPSGKLGKYISITLQLCYPEDIFKEYKFTPHKNNIRKKWRLCLTSTPDDDATTPTPRYNSAILYDITSNNNNRFLSDLFTDCDNIKDSIILLKIWLQQRSITSFNGFLINMFVAYLIKSKRINNAMSSYQIIRNVWTSLAASEWDSNGITLFSGEPTQNHPLVDDFHGFYPVVFVDNSGYNNLCANLSLDAYKNIQSECKLALELLDGEGTSGFMALFMTPVVFHLKYDHILKIDYSKYLDVPMKKHLDEQAKIDVGLALRPMIVDYLYEVLTKGLGERITLLTLKDINHQDTIWDITERIQSKSIFFKPIIFGIKLNPAEAFNFVDKGPPANLPDAERFREFWGAKSTLRRFQDGSICEACVWSMDNTLASKRLIVKEIILYLLQTKLNIEKKIYYTADQVEYILHNKVVEPSNFKCGTGEEASMVLSSSFDSLMQSLRNLTNMPLDIHSIQGTSSVFSFTEPLPPIPRNLDASLINNKYEKYQTIEEISETSSCPEYIPTLKVIVQLSQSGKWPNQIEALRKIKAAFNIQIAQALEKQCLLTCYPRQEYVDVVKNGYVFRIEVAHRKEIILLREIIDSEGITKYRDCEESLEIEHRTSRLPRIRTALNGLYHQNNCYGAATCLLKRWIRAHMIDSSHFPDICIELLVASQFLKCGAYGTSHQPQVAFFRALSMLANTDWNTNMIVLNFNDDLSRDDITSLETTFMSSRETLPSLCIVTPYDGNRTSVWSKPHPTVQILARLQILASEALNMINTYITQNPVEPPTELFVSNTTGYDIIIKVKSEWNPLSPYNHKNAVLYRKPAKLETYFKSEDEIIPIVDFDPVQIYLNQLRSSYDDYALFFHDTYGGDTIAILWKPVIHEIKEFKTSILNGRKLTDKKEKPHLVTDIDAILEGILLLGHGLVEEIENKTNVIVK